MSLELHPIGYVSSDRTAPVDDQWNSVRSEIVLDDKRFTPEALAGLADFSHVEILFSMNQATKSETGARHPRGNAAWPKVGIFAQRGKDRPNHIGATVCRILQIEGLTLRLEGLDAIDGSPVLDIKPWVREFGPRGEVKQPAWIGELMRSYW